MTRFLRTEKVFLSLALAGLLCSFYYLATSEIGDQPKFKTGMPLGQVNLSKGDTRWKGEAQTHQFKTWDKQRLYAGDTLYAGAASRLGFYIGEIHLDLKPQTRVALKAGEENFVLEAAFGQLEMHLPPGERLRVSVDKNKKFLDLVSVNGSRVNVQVEDGRGLRVQNIAGDLVVKTQGRTEYTVPEEEIFRAGSAD